jgi:murein DD-endopeptidase MepM/ murein hydrolase activator NlpD
MPIQAQQTPIHRRLLHASGDSLIGSRGAAVQLKPTLRIVTVPLASLLWAATLAPAEAMQPIDAVPSAPAATASPPASQTRPSVPTPSAHGRRFWVKDKRFYYSDWYAGRHRKMINFGCTRAPYYDSDPRCIKDRGFHHGLDVAMACGTRLFAGFRGRVVRPGSRGALGPAYGAHAFRIRNQRLGKDFVIGHVRRVYVDPGDRIHRGQLIARASDDAAPDGCHLHFEVRPERMGYSSAVHPRDYIRLHLRR